MRRILFGALMISAGMLAFAPSDVTRGVFTREITFQNDTPFPADGLHVALSAFQYWPVDMAVQPGRCPAAGVDTGAYDANVAWGELCVRPGESVTIRLQQSDFQPTAEAVASWTHAGLGDSNCGGTTDPIDASLDLQLVAALIDTVPCEMNADFNGDGAITVIDATLTLQLSAGLFSV
jgi:hypothetical protein